MIEFDYAVSTTFRLAEAEQNGERLRREDYMSHKEREDEAWVEARLGEMKLLANNDFVEPLPGLGQAGQRQLVEQSRTLASHNRELVAYLEKLQGIIEYYQKKKGVRKPFSPQGSGQVKQPNKLKAIET